MRKAVLGVVILVVAIVLLVALLPYLSTKEKISYEEAVSKWAKGKFVTVDIRKGSQLVVIDKAGHTPQEEDPGKFNQLALEFPSR
jgi:pimeloyl-ACP methyl ester carboxylesterase